MHSLSHQKQITTSGLLSPLCSAVIGLAISAPVLHAQFEITSYTVDAGGGQSSGGSFSLTGTAGQVDAAPVQSGAPFLLGSGFWGFSASLNSSFASWVLENVLPGQDGSFAGDADGNGIPNAVEYVFGNVGFEALATNTNGAGKVPAPPSTPSDVDISLELSSPDIGTPLQDWFTIVSWSGGPSPSITDPSSTSIASGEVTDTSNTYPFFYRYQLNQR